MGLLKTRAVVLKSQRWGEADRIVTLYTEQVGKIRGIARGARRMKSRLGGALEPFGCVDVTMFEKSPDTLARISQVDLVRSFGRLREQLSLMNDAARMVNLVRSITVDRDPNPVIFSTLVGGLHSLASAHPGSLCALVFQIQVLAQTGFRPQMDHCAGCGGNLPLKALRFSPRAGGLVCGPCSDREWDRCLLISPGSVAFLQQARRLPFPTVTRLRATAQIRREVEEAIDSYVRVVIGKPLPVWEGWVAEPGAPVYSS